MAASHSIPWGRVWQTLGVPTSSAVATIMGAISCPELPRCPPNQSADHEAFDLSACIAAQRGEKYRTENDRRDDKTCIAVQTKQIKHAGFIERRPAIGCTSDPPCQRYHREGQNFAKPHRCGNAYSASKARLHLRQPNCRQCYCDRRTSCSNGDDLPITQPRCRAICEPRQSQSGVRHIEKDANQKMACLVGNYRHWHQNGSDDGRRPFDPPETRNVDQRAASSSSEILLTQT